MTIEETEIKQNEFAEELDKLNAYPGRKSKYIDLKESVFKNTKIFHEVWEKIVYGLKNRILPLSKKFCMKTDGGDQQPNILDISKQKKFNDFLFQIKEEQKNIDIVYLNRFLVMAHLTKCYRLYTI